MGDFLESLCYLIGVFIFLIIIFMFCCCLGDLFTFSSYDEKLESFCNQFHDTQSCSVVYKNDDVVLFDTYNGYVTVENILK